ncbi:MAG: DUF4157 domain-containing protein, partial [Pyrinomonadaceae bacterium]
DLIADRVMKGGLRGSAPPLPPPGTPPQSSSTLLIQRAPASGPTSSKESDEEAAAATSPPTLSLIVEDDEEQLSPGQMRKTEFLAALRAATCAAADRELARIGRDTESCPYISRAFEHYRTQASSRLERSLRRYAPEATKAKEARGYIEAVSARVARAVGVWAETGEVADVPEELAAEMSGSMWIGGVKGLASMAEKAVGGLIGKAGKALSGLGSMLFKARAGGARTERAEPAAIKSQLHEGESLDAGVKSRMERAFSHDFSRVRVYRDSRAAELSASLNARAFTMGSDVGFGEGEYRPGTLSGDALIAHELAHVVQQGNAGQSSTAPMTKPEEGTTAALEEDADVAAVGAVASSWGGFKRGLLKFSKQAMPRLKSGLQLQRCSNKKVNDYEIHGVSEDRTIASINFERNKAELDDLQKEKIAALKSPPGRALSLYSFVSEDENIPPEQGKKLAHTRYVVVDKALRGKPDPHTGDQKLGGEDTTSSCGQWNYRNWRKVKVVPASDTSSGEKDCSGGGEQPCSDDSKFTSAQAKVDSLLTPAINVLNSPLADPGKSLLDKHFHTKTDAERTTAATVAQANLTKVKDHIKTQMSPTGTRGTTDDDRVAGHVCANECDPICASPDAGAHNSGVDDKALMTLCDTSGAGAFMQQTDEKERALTLIHEGLHGVTIALPPGGTAPPGKGALDYSYEWQRLILFLDTQTALKNNDSYVLFVREANGDTPKIGPPSEDTEDFLDSEFFSKGEREDADRAMAWLAGWLLWSQQEVSSLYRTINDSRKAGEWTNQYYEGTMDRIATLFEMTKPPAVPNEKDQLKVAAIHDRLFRLSRLVFKPVEFKKVKSDDTSWGKGPTRNISIGPDFFKEGKKARTHRSQLDLLIMRMLEASPDISKEARPRYLKMLDNLRQHKSGGAPEG